MSCENGDGSSNTSGIRQRRQPRSRSWGPVGSTCLPRFSRSGDSTSVEPRVADESAFSCDCHPESAPRRNTVRVRGPIPDRLKNLCEIPRRLTSRVLLLKLLRNESIEMSFPKSDSPAEFHEFNLSITDPMPQRTVRNAEVRRSFRRCHQV